MDQPSVQTGGVSARVTEAGDGVSRYDRVTAEESVAVSVAEALAERRGETLSETTFQLYDYVDAEAVDQLLSHTAPREGVSWELTFAVDEAEVTVTSEGEIRVT